MGSVEFVMVGGDPGARCNTIGSAKADITIPEQNIILLKKPFATFYLRGTVKMRVFGTPACNWSKPYLELSNFAEN